MIPAGSADKLVRAAKQLSVNSFIYPVATLPGAEAELALPRGCEEQAALVEAPAAEHTPHFQTLDCTERVLGVDAHLVFDLAHNGRLRCPWSYWPRRPSIRSRSRSTWPMWRSVLSPSLVISLVPESGLTKK